MVNNNNYKVEGAKAGDKPRQPNIAKDSVSSISTAKILYGLNDGEISGIVGGGKGIKLEDTPLLDEAGKENFKGVKWDFRAGTLDQEYIEGFPDISNETGVGVELKGGVDWIKAISNPVLSAVRIRLSWNGLRKQNIENGDVSGYKIDYAVDVKTGSGAYIEVLKTNINDKVTGKYERTHRIALPKSSSGWQIRVRRLTPNANLDNVQDKMFIESITEVIDQKFTYPHTSLLGIQYDAKTFSRIAKLAVRCKGKLIKIPSNYNSDANTYTGVWNGQFKLEYSNNPAWIFYDLVTSKRYGLGKRIDPSMVDKWSLYDLGAYCDALVPDGQGSTEKRYTCNVYLQSQAEAYQILSQLSGIFRAITYWSGQQLVLSADVPKDPTYTFSRANVIDGQFEYTGTRARDRHTVAKVAFDNPKENFKTEYEYIRDEAGIAKFGINVIDISAIGCTSRGQAQRAGLWALKSEQLETRTVTFRTGLEGFNLLVGEVIEVSDELLAGRANGGRITAVDSTLKGVTVDREAVIKVNDFITVNAKDGISQRRKVVAVSGKVVTVLTPFVEVEAGAVWAISSVDLNTMQFRVMSIKPDEDNIFAITAIQHEPLKYAAVDHGADVKPTSISIIKPTNVAPPASVGLSANYRVVQGQSVATLVIQWSQVKDAVGYSVEWRRNDGNWIKLPLTGNVSAEVEGVYEGNYQARVKSVNAFDVESDFTNSIVTNIKGKVGSPKALASITATGILFGMDIKWNFLAGSEDTNYTEIQTATSSTGANTALLGSFSYPTDKTTVNGLQGGLTVFYRGRIVDKLGNAGNWSAWVSGTTDASADKVLEILEGQITESQLFTDLKTKIDKIDTNESSLDGLGVDLTAANQAIDKAKADIVEANRVIEANRTAANLSIEAANKNITDNKTALDLDLVAANKLIKDNKDKLVLTDADLLAAKTKVTNLETDYNGNKTTVSNTLVSLTNKDISLSADLTKLSSDFDGNKAEVVKDLKALVDKDVALTNSYTSLQSDYDGNKAKISQDITTLSNKDIALTNSITTLESEVEGNAASIISNYKTLSDANTATANKLDGVYAQVNPDLIGSENDLIGNDTKKAGVWSEQSARIEEDLALSIRSDNLESVINDNTATIKQNFTTLVDRDKALASLLTSLESNYNGNKAKIDNELVVLVDKDKALSDSLVLLQADYDSNKSSVSNKLTALTDKDTSLSSSLTALDSDYKGNKTAIRNELTAVSNKTNSTASSLLTLESEVEGNTASIIANYKTLSDKDTATATKLDGVYAQVNPLLMGDSEALVGNDTKFSGVWSEQSARIEEDLALAIRSDNLQSKLEDNTALISQNFNTLVDKDKALASLITTVSSEFNTNKSAVQNQITVLNNKDTSLGQQIATVESTANGNKSSIQTQATAINGLSAQWSVKLDVNGYVSGIGQYNNGTTSQFAVNASQFYIADPTSKTASTPFQVLTTATEVNGVVVPIGTYITDGYIKNASIGLAKINTASITNLSALSANIGHFKSAATGARLEIKDSLLSVYDSNNNLRVRLGIW